MNSLSQWQPFTPLTRRQWIWGSVLFVVFFSILLLSDLQVKNPILFFPASGIALGILFLEGIELWPFIFLASLLGNYFGGFPLPFVLLMPVGQTLQAILGAYFFRRFNLDPLFRRSRDAFILLGVISIAALIVPTFSSLSNELYFAATNTAFPLTSWLYRYTSTLFSLLIITPFILRWIAKPRFSRTWIEILELVAVFALLIILDLYVFISTNTSVAGVPLLYVLMVPLFWIALRLRPRFITLAMLITSGIALLALTAGTYSIGSVEFSNILFQIETLLITLGTMFFIVVTLEENRRLNSNLLINQLSTLENAVTRISSESEAKNDFIAVLAHELRNPLAPVVSGIDLLKLKNDLDEDEIETLAVMEDRMHTVKRLLDDLLDISRISEGKIVIAKSRVDLLQVAKRAMLSTAHHIKERHQLFVYKESSEPISVKGDAVRLEQVFSNLITNASKYSDSGDQINLSITTDGGYAIIQVRDTGIGIKAESLQHIFLPFHQVELGARTRKGLGIGLALVRNFVELHDGTVIGESEGVGKGSTFTVKIPLA